MDDLDCRILDALQHDFPLREHPFDILAQRLGVDPELLWGRVEAMRNSGVIRRLGASLDSRKLGFRSTLAAIRVRSDLPPDAQRRCGPDAQPGCAAALRADGWVDRAAEVIGRHPEVTHSYLRDHELNIWFTIIAPDDKQIDAVLREIREALSLEPSDVLNLPMKRLFKLDARFRAPP
ncbi:MAG: Lrp/AsnC family transcriptional regulator [Planctomycetes bacterium]|nr:Lrp/AsnC family transcriptional regulator [Planctomycetota bacterium]